MSAVEKTRFEDVYGYILKNTLSLDAGNNISGELSIENYETSIKSGIRRGTLKQYSYVLFIPNYPDMQNELQLSKKTIQKYLLKFCKVGILKKLRKTDARGNSVYAVGYYAPYINKDKEKQVQRILFLKNSPEIRTALRDFKIRD